MKNNIFKVMAVAVVAFCCVSCDKIAELTGDKKEDPEKIIKEFGQLVDGQRYKTSGNTAEVSRPYKDDDLDTRSTIVIPKSVM